MKKWKDISKNEKWMLVIMLLLIVGIALRWNHVKTELAEAFSWFNRSEKTETAAPSEQAVTK